MFKKFVPIKMSISVLLGTFLLSIFSILPSDIMAPAMAAGVTKFVDPLPIAAVAKPKGKLNGADYYEINEVDCWQKLHRDLPATHLFGYDGMVPGPTIEAKEGVPVIVKFTNNLPETHILPIDHTLMGAGTDVPDVRTVIHLHGANCPTESDGFPTDWFSHGQSQTYYYPNQQSARTMWYHDHSMGITRLNPYAGLAAFYIIRDDFEKTLKLPSGKYEVAMVIQDKMIDANAQLYMPPAWEPETFGDVIAVNGKAWPYMTVEPRRYRLRILNGANARFFHMKFSNNMPMYQLAAEAGFLPAPVILNDLLLGPGERADIIVDFSKFKGQTITLTNDAATPYPSGDPITPDMDTAQIMQFKVKVMPAIVDPSRIPTSLRPITLIPESEAVKTRDILLSEMDMANGLPMPWINESHFTDPVTEAPQQGTTEIWRLINTTGDSHPMHMHMINFQVLDRIPFNADQYMSDKALGNLQPLEFYYTGAPVLPALNEAAWKETAVNPPGYVTRYIMKWDCAAGLSVYHCHILEHEENDMMRPMRIISGDHPNTAADCSPNHDHFADCDKDLFGGMGGMGTM